MTTEDSFCWCPECKRWVPSSKMRYYENLRVCAFCLGEEIPKREYVHDPNFGKTKCVYCDSYNTEKLDNGSYKCKDCTEIFWRF